MNVSEAVKHTGQCCELVRTWFQKILMICSLLDGGGRSAIKCSGIHWEFRNIAALLCLRPGGGWRSSASASSLASARTSDIRVAANRSRSLNCTNSIAAGVVQEGRLTDVIAAANRSLSCPPSIATDLMQWGKVLAKVSVVLVGRSTDVGVVEESTVEGPTQRLGV